MESTSDSIIVSLTPPRLSKENLFKKTTCTRPMREGQFNISKEKRGSKTLLHCYGHGGSGWTLLFGSVNEALRLFQQGVAPGSAVRVVGSGCMGLTCAIELARQGYRVSITTKDLYDSPSWKAAGYCALVSIKTSPEEQDHLHAVGIETFKVYQQIEQGKHPYIAKEVVRYMPVYCSKETESGVEELAKQGFIPPPQEVTLDFGGGVQHPDFVQYMTYAMDTIRIMRGLLEEVKRLNIPIEIREIHSFDEIQEENIFNCSGLGAKTLNADSQLIAVRGLLFLMGEEAGSAHMNYMIYTKVKQNGQEEYIYMFPKSMACHGGEWIPCHGVLGGTFLPRTDQLSLLELEKLDALEFTKMHERILTFFYGP